MTTVTACSAHGNAVAKSWYRNVAQTISMATPLCRDVANLVTQYLPPIDGWITEWTGERGREIVAHAMKQAETPLTHDSVNLITQYLKKRDVFGLADLEHAARGKDELAKLLGNYNPEQPLPLEIDDEMQKDLGEIFSEGLPYRLTSSKVTELFSLYWCPKGMTANIAQQIVKNRQQFHRDAREDVLKEHGNSPTKVDNWIQFPNDVFGRFSTLTDLEALIPTGFEFPHFVDVVFCVFMKDAYMDTMIMRGDIFTCCQEEWIEKYKVAVGGFSYQGLRVASFFGDEDAKCGVAALRKFS